jgi:hypothetical protein
LSAVRCANVPYSVPTGDEADALRELSEVLSAGFGLHLDEGAEPVHEPDVAHGGGLSFAEFQEFLRSRRARSAAVT